MCVCICSPRGQAVTKRMYILYNYVLEEVICFILNSFLHTIIITNYRISSVLNIFRCHEVRKTRERQRLNISSC